VEPKLVGTPPSPPIELGSTNSDKDSGSKSSSGEFLNIPSPITNPPKKYRSFEGERDRSEKNTTEIPKMNFIEIPESPSKALYQKDEELAGSRKRSGQTIPLMVGADSILTMEFEEIGDKIKTGKESDAGRGKIQTKSGWENNREGHNEKDVFGKNSLPKTSKMESMDASIINVNT
jgi:hypothetical protein